MTSVTDVETLEAHVRQRFVVKDKAPLLVTRIAELRLERLESGALARARPWRPADRPTIDAGAIMAGHLKLSRSRGLQAAAARAMVSLPGVMNWGLESDYKRNLY